MKLSTRGKYGTRLMIDLALHYKKGQVFLREIAARQKISEKYLWHLIAPLKNAGLIHSTRGAQGGYALAKSPKEITLRNIVLILEGPLFVSDSDRSGDSQTLKDIWKEVSAKVDGVLGSFTLEDMAERYRRKSKVIEYVI